MFVPLVLFCSVYFGTSLGGILAINDGILYYIDTRIYILFYTLFIETLYLLICKCFCEDNIKNYYIFNAWRPLAIYAITGCIIHINRLTSNMIYSKCFFIFMVIYTCLCFLYIIFKFCYPTKNEKIKEIELIEF